MKNQKDRMMRSQPTIVLICLSECQVNGYGPILKDAEVSEATHPGLVEYLTRHGEHPNFKLKEA